MTWNSEYAMLYIDNPVRTDGAAPTVVYGQAVFTPSLFPLSLPIFYPSALIPLTFLAPYSPPPAPPPPPASQQVGTGFSFTGSDAGYSTNELQVGYNLHRCKCIT